MSQQRKDEIQDHILNSIKIILRAFQKDQKKISEDTAKVAKRIQKMIEEDFKKIPDIDTMVLAIQSIPTRYNNKFMEKTYDLIERQLLRKKDNENAELTHERLAEWIKLWFKYVNVVKIEYREQVMKTQEKVMEMTGAVDPMDVPAPIGNYEYEFEEAKLKKN